MTKSYVRTATRTTLKVEANLTQILNFKANFHTEFELFFKKKIYANNGGHFKIVSVTAGLSCQLVDKRTVHSKLDDTKAYVDLNRFIMRTRQSSSQKWVMAITQNNVSQTKP